MDNSAIITIARTAGEAQGFETVERIGHGRPRHTGMRGQDRHWDRLRINLEQQHENGELELAQSMTGEDAAKVATQSLGSSQTSKRNATTRGIDAVPASS